MYHVRDMIILVILTLIFYILEDPYILAGSCGVEFYLNRNSDYQHSYSHSSRSSSDWSYQPNWFWSFFDSLKTLGIFFLVVTWIIGLVGLNALLKFMYSRLVGAH